LKLILEKYSKEQVKKASQIKALFFDVDGVLTDGKIVYDESGKEIKRFNVKDGQIVAYLKKSGIIVGAISGRESATTAKRAAELKFDFCHQGIVDKAQVVQKLAKHYDIKLKDIAYIGDDVNDAGVFEIVGMPVCPADTFDYIKARVMLVTKVKGGQGVLREVADLILAAKGEFDKVLK
jgi:3-deoxy-D-manno-octulosonate 8-phosphate phosphatase (KDO 8-P phosphatase)